jgi:mRNA interferase RelE/StbE
VIPQPAKPYELHTTPTVRRQLAEQLPEAVATAALESITGPLFVQPASAG